jgi:hypothetical protein
MSIIYYVEPPELALSYPPLPFLKRFLPCLLGPLATSSSSYLLRCLVEARLVLVLVISNSGNPLTASLASPSVIAFPLDNYQGHMRGHGYKFGGFGASTKLIMHILLKLKCLYKA